LALALAGRKASHRTYLQYIIMSGMASGECGEVCEIFQWKGSLESYHNNEHNADFSEKENVKIGEEIADVFIYTTRLSDVCCIDLAHAVRLIFNKQPSAFDFKLPIDPFSNYEASVFLRPQESNQLWDSLDLSYLSESVLDTTMHPYFRSRRHIVLSLQSHVGQVCQLFGSKSESECLAGLTNWPVSDVSKLATLLGTICILLMFLAYHSNQSLSTCISDYFDKKEGRSIKYTKYGQQQTKAVSVDKIGVAYPAPFSILILTVAVALGYFLAQCL